MAKIFLSYSRQDLKIALELCGGLKASGHDVWMDVDGISAGEHWQTRIVRAIASSDVLLVMLSHSSATSDQIRREVSIGDARKIKIVPVAIDESPIPEHLIYVLAGLQMVDLSPSIDHAIASIVRILPPSQVAEPRGEVAPVPRTNVNAVGVLPGRSSQRITVQSRLATAALLASIGALAGLTCYRLFVHIAGQTPSGGMNITQFVLEPALAYALTGAILGALNKRVWIILFSGLLTSSIWEIATRLSYVGSTGDVQSVLSYGLLYSGIFSLIISMCITLVGIFKAGPSTRKASDA